ncbi:unnamed protein product [Rangifer tarandus platyrhynchus]|uniref:Uncharacterized protein n=2 Tax=Rangifer tarandus platyrhynchus TaxID=3082113 RepID=A0ABN8YAA8_RANTA|nr:unnamed protein product [Rangifer tarandus platyrhynchus]
MKLTLEKVARPPPPPARPQSAYLFLSISVIVSKSVVTPLNVPYLASGSTFKLIYGSFCSMPISLWACSWFLPLCSKFVIYFSCPRLGTGYFSKEPWFLFMRNGIWKSRSGCCWGVNCSLALSENRARQCIFYKFMLMYGKNHHNIVK